MNRTRNFLSMVEIYFELSMISFKNYLKLIEDNFEQQKKIITGRYNQFKKSIEDNNHSHYPQHLTYDQLYELEEEFVQRFRQSLIIQLFSFIESNLKGICFSHALSTHSIYSVIDLKGNSDLDKIKKYLYKSMNVEIGKFHLCSFINSLRILRNKIVHEDGSFQTKDNDFNNFCAFAENRFDLKSHNPDSIFYNIKLNKRSFLDECIMKVEEFMREVMFAYKPVFRTI